MVVQREREEGDSRVIRYWGNVGDSTQHDFVERINEENPFSSIGANVDKDEHLTELSLADID